MQFQKAIVVFALYILTLRKMALSAGDSLAVGYPSRSDQRVSPTVSWQGLEDVVPTALVGVDVHNRLYSREFTCYLSMKELLRGRIEGESFNASD